MCGGYFRRGVDFYATYVSALISYAKIHKLSMAAIFLDVAAAFESLKRFFVFSDKISDDQAANVFAKAGFAPDISGEFLDKFQQNFYRNLSHRRKPGLYHILQQY